MNPAETDVIALSPIGIIHSPHRDIANMPIQPVAAEGVRGHIELFRQYQDGLKDLDGFSHITLIYRFHRINGYNLQVVPFMDTEPRGVFSTRAPKRPNAIGMSTVKVVGVRDNVVEIEQVDILDGTPLLDIKPFYRRYDNRMDAVCGWLDKQTGMTVERMRSDERFR